MTATWELVSTDDVTPIRLSFYAGRAGLLPNYETYRVATADSDSKFNNHYDADEYAATLGVECWRLIAHNKSHPFAATIPIVFDDAPGSKRIAEFIVRFANGETLQELASELQQHNNTGASISPVNLRNWMLGSQPLNSALNGLRPKRYAKQREDGEKQ